jgi:hypothetical protein
MANPASSGGTKQEGTESVTLTQAQATAIQASLRGEVVVAHELRVARLRVGP